jgi:polar amino acid transport system substrate-binding protein
MGKTHSLATGLLVVTVALAGFVIACGSDQGGGAIETPPERAARILGHVPTGLAADIVRSGTMVVANDAHYPPQSSVDEKTGRLVGFDVDVAERVGRILGLRVAFRDRTPKTVATGLDRGAYDVSIGSMTVTAERESALDFTQPYYFTSGQVFVKKGGRQISGARDLDGKRVGAGVATTYLDYLEANTDADVVIYRTDAEAAADLAGGKLDFLMAAGQVGQQAILGGQPLDFSGAPLYYENLAFAVKQGERDWLAMLDHAVQTMHEDGSLEAMSRRWFNGVDLTVRE